MTQEEFLTLPSCLRYENSNVCGRGYDWGFSDYDDPCEGCSANRWNCKDKYMSMTLEEAWKDINEYREYIKKLENDNKRH
jgi:hypothetical protein